MKIAPSASSGKPSKKVNHIIPLEDDEAHHKLTKENSVTWELRTVPADGNSPTCEVLTRVPSGEESVRQMLRWAKDLDKVCIGLNATDLASMKPIMRACMRPRVETLFEATLLALAELDKAEALKAAQVADNGTGATANVDQVTAQSINDFRRVEHLKIAIQEVLRSLMPAKVLAKVKRQVRREMRKPVDMKVRSYCQHLLRLNTDDIPSLPPFMANQALSSDELLDILLHGTPRSWQNEMDRQGFDPIEKGYYTTVDFMENLEGLEEKSLAHEAGTTSKDKSKSTKPKEKNPEGAKKKTTHFCQLHGPNWTHNTSECRGMKDKEKSTKFSNKSWTRKADEATNKSKNDLAAFLAKTVKDGVKKELASIGKKRKSKTNDGEQECALVELFEKNLDGFNYDDMDSVSVKSEVSC